MASNDGLPLMHLARPCLSTHTPRQQQRRVYTLAGAFLFTFDALIGVAAWRSSIKWVELHIGCRRTIFPCAHDELHRDVKFDWSGIACMLFVVGGLMEVRTRAYENS